VWRHQRADGSELLVQPYAQPLPYGQATALLCALFDVTERERAAEALVQARDEAEAANRAKGHFLANMSHEIRTPLNGVIGVLSTLERTRLDSEQREMVSIIGASATTLQRLLNDVLDSSRIESGALTIEAAPFDLHSSVHTLTELFAPNAREKGVAFGVVLEDTVPAWVEGDQQRVRQVLGNLLSNAVKFTEVGSVQLTVDAREPGWVRFTVADTGVGFDAEFHARLFERFEQADTSVTRRFGGSGLGLSIARDLVDRMGGALTARSTPGAGSTFVLSLPLAETARPDEAPAPAAAEQHAPASERPLRVLLADDHPINRRVVELMLSTLDVELTAVEDGALALEAFEAQAFDLVLMDLQMPVMDGLEAIRRIRGREASRNLPPTPIYVLSANAMDEHVAAARAAGATAHLSKPIAAAALLAVIQAVDDSLRLAA
jgi:signal transduction histidine kinase/ActR/RegA family two-component response regulator